MSRDSCQLCRETRHCQPDHKEVVHGKRGISADTALRLSRALGLTDRFFINMPAQYDAEIARAHLVRELAFDRADRFAPSKGAEPCGFLAWRTAEAMRAGVPNSATARERDLHYLAVGRAR